MPSLETCHFIGARSIPANVVEALTIFLLLFVICRDKPYGGTTKLAIFRAKTIRSTLANWPN
jgi:hypothetical protein